MHWEGCDRSIWIDLIVRVYPESGVVLLQHFCLSIGVYPVCCFYTTALKIVKKNPPILGDQGLLLID
jgi:hypothetical protein